MLHLVAFADFVPHSLNLSYLLGLSSIKYKKIYALTPCRVYVSIGEA